MRLLLFILAFGASVSPASAEARTLRFVQAWTTDLPIHAIWKDRISEAPEAVWIAEEGPFIVSIRQGEARIFDPYVQVYSGPICPDLTQTIDLETRTWVACGRSLVLPIGQGDE
ncbi:hypothetical protein [Aureimonas psammosilenae]|uniref:hypothetical protein n=1 Tax=Aureimonas psammosilenae TaxID=2495496 RepID=UPI001260BCDD|nr:hypothetical protein [Aureimonas psammosilenae]